MSFEVKTCQLLHFGPHRAIRGRTVGAVRVKICETLLGNETTYTLDLKVKADVGTVSSDELRHALLGHAARQLNKLKLRHTALLPVAAE